MVQSTGMRLQALLIFPFRCPWRLALASCLLPRDPQMAAPAPSLSSRRQKGDKAKGKRAKSFLLAKVCLLLPKRNPPQEPSLTCHWLEVNNMANSSCKGGWEIKGTSLQLMQQREAITKGLVVSATLSLWGLGFLSLWLHIYPSLLSLKAGFVPPNTRQEMAIPALELHQTLSSRTTNDLCDIPESTSKH